MYRILMLPILSTLAHEIGQYLNVYAIIVCVIINELNIYEGRAHIYIYTHTQTNKQTKGIYNSIRFDSYRLMRIYQINALLLDTLTSFLVLSVNRVIIEIYY